MPDAAPLWRVEHGDSIEVIAQMEGASVHAVVCDPPYGLSREPDAAEVLAHWLQGDDYRHRGSGFMGKGWDSFVPGPALWREAFRVLRPGGHLIAFGGTRTFDLLTMAIRLAGFEIRDRILTIGGAEVNAELAWTYSSGWPKGLNVAQAIDREAGAQGEVIGEGENYGRTTAEDGKAAFGDVAGTWQVRAPATPEAQQWDGWSTALKPAYEPIIVARRPLDRGATIAQQVKRTGTGAINVDACRVAYERPPDTSPRKITRRTPALGDERSTSGAGAMGAGKEFETSAHSGGRWPPNLLLIHHPDCERTGTRRVPVGVTVRRNSDGEPEHGSIFVKNRMAGPDMTYGDDGTSTETVEQWTCVEGCPVAELDRQSGQVGAAAPASGPTQTGGSSSQSRGEFAGMAGRPAQFHADKGAASRFFPAFQYVPKAAQAERDAGLEDRVPGERGNRHPTVKPVALMAWLVRLVVPPGGVVLDPFCGSGSTGCAAVREGVSFIGVDADAEYAALARDRIAWWADVPAGADPEEQVRRSARAHRQRTAARDAGQMDLLALTEDAS